MKTTIAETVDRLVKTGCWNCACEKSCATNYCDAAWNRAYNIRDCKDCWKPVLVWMEDLKRGDIFEKDGHIEVVIDNNSTKYMWTTKPEYYNEADLYTDISAATIEVQKIQVRLIGNMRDIRKENCKGEANMKTTVTKIMDKIKHIDNVIDGLYKYRENVSEINEAVDLLREYRNSILSTEVDM